MIGQKAEFMNVQFSWGLVGIILRILRLEVFLHNGYITNQIQITFAQRDDFVDSKEENS